MRYSTQVKPISYLKANAAEVLDKLAENHQPLIITQNGEAKAVMQDLATYENTQETLALLDQSSGSGLDYCSIGNNQGLTPPFRLTPAFRDVLAQRECRRRRYGLIAGRLRIGRIKRDQGTDKKQGVNRFDMGPFGKH